MIPCVFLGLYISGYMRKGKEFFLHGLNIIILGTLKLKADKLPAHCLKPEIPKWWEYLISLPFRGSSKKRKAV